MTDTITTDLEPVPSRQRPGTFSDEADTFFGKFPTWADEANALATGANANAVSVESYATDASTSADKAETAASTSTANANFKGEWSSLTGPLEIPASVYHDNIVWVLISNLEDVTLKEPGVDPEWVYSNSAIFENETDLAMVQAVALYF